MIPTQLQEILPGISIEYRLAGPLDAPTIVFLHELGTNLHQFDIQQLLLSQKYQVLLISFRGHGRSQIALPQQPEFFSINQLAIDILYVMNTLKIQKAHLIGNGLGYLTSLEIFNIAPQSVHSLTSFGSFARLHPQSIFEWKYFKTEHHNNLNPTKRKFKKIPGKKSIHKQLITMSQNTSQDALVYLSQHISRYDYSKILQNSGAVPKLFIPCEQQCKLLKKYLNQVLPPAAIRYAQIATICSTGQFSNMENPSQFNHILTNFIQGL